MDLAYLAAQKNLKNRVEQFTAASTTDPDGVPMQLQVKKVLFSGAPDEDGVVVHTRESFAKKFGREYEHGKPKDRLDAVFTFALDRNPEAAASGKGETDLRAASHSDVTQAVLKAVKGAFTDSGIRTDTIDFSGELAAQGGKIKPSIIIDTSVVDGKLHNEVHVSMDLPEGVSHDAAIRKLARSQLVVGPRTAALGSSPADEGLARTA